MVNKKQIEIGNFRDFVEFREAEGRAAELQTQRQQLQDRASVIQAKLSRTGSSGSGMAKLKNAAMKLISRAVPEPEENIEALKEEYQELSGKIPVLDVAIRLQNEELVRLRSVLSPRICEPLVASYKERLLEAGRKYLEAVKSFQELDDFRQNLRDKDISFVAWIQAFNLPSAGRLEDHASTPNMILREIQDYAGASVEGWEDPMITSQPKPGKKRKVRLTTTMAGPQGIAFSGQIIASEFADYLVKSRQAVEISQVEALRARLDLIPAQS